MPRITKEQERIFKTIKFHSNWNSHHGTHSLLYNFLLFNFPALTHDMLGNCTHGMGFMASDRLYPQRGGYKKVLSKLECNCIVYLGSFYEYLEHEKIEGIIPYKSPEAIVEAGWEVEISSDDDGAIIDEILGKIGTTRRVGS